MKPQPSKSFIVSYFSQRITKLNDTLAEMVEATPEQYPAIGCYLSRQLEDLQAEVEHVLEYGETSGWPGHQLWENKINTGTPENQHLNILNIMTTKNENFTLPNGCVLTPEAMELLHRLQFNQTNSFNGEKNQDIAMYSNMIANIQDRIAENAHRFRPDEHDEWRNTLLHIAELVDIKRIINVFSHPDGD